MKRHYGCQGIGSHSKTARLLIDPERENACFRLHPGIAIANWKPRRAAYRYEEIRDARIVPGSSAGCSSPWYSRGLSATGREGWQHHRARRRDQSHRNQAAGEAVNSFQETTASPAPRHPNATAIGLNLTPTPQSKRAIPRSPYSPSVAASSSGHEV